MKIVIHQAAAAMVTEATPTELAWLAQVMTCVADDKVFKFFQPNVRTLPAGLVATARYLGSLQGVTVDVDDAVGRAIAKPHNVRDPEVAKRLGLSYLHPYQLDAVAAMAEKRYGVIKMPTGAGKTEVGVSLTRAVPGRWIIFAHRTNLVQQFSERYMLRTKTPVAQFDKRTGELVWPGDRAVRADEECFAAIPFASAAKHIGSYGRTFATMTGMFCDEAHCVAAKTHSIVAGACCNAYYRIGLTATPMVQGDERTLLVSANVGPVRIHVDTQELIRQGYLSKPTILMMPVKYAPPMEDEWHGVYRECIVENDARNDALALAAKHSADPFMLFVGDVKNGHLKEMVSRCEKLGRNVKPVSGVSKARDRIVQELRDGDLDGIVTTEVFQEGVDVPELRSVIVGSGEQSVVAAIQRLGRGTRVTADKKTFALYDVYDYADLDECAGDAYVPAAYCWLEKHARARARAYASEGHDVRVGMPGEEGVPFTEFEERLKQERMSRGIVPRL